MTQKLDLLVLCPDALLIFNIIVARLFRLNNFYWSMFKFTNSFLHSTIEPVRESFMLVIILSMRSVSDNISFLLLIVSVFISYFSLLKCVKTIFMVKDMVYFNEYSRYFVENVYSSVRGREFNKQQLGHLVYSVRFTMTSWLILWLPVLPVTQRKVPRSQLQWCSRLLSPSTCQFLLQIFSHVITCVHVQKCYVLLRHRPFYY